jgi:hypothetical protein
MGESGNTDDEVLGPLRRRLEIIEIDIGVPVGFLDSIPNEHDWSLVIKLHAVIESALDRVIAGALQPRSEQLSRFVSDLPLRGRTSRLRLARLLGVIGKDEHQFIETLQELRNDFAHDPKSVGATLENYLSARSDQRAHLENVLFGARVAAELELKPEGLRNRVDLC